MSEPLTTTFGLLASTGNPHAVDPLVAALDSGVPVIETMAIQALVRRGSARGLVEAIRRIDHLCPDARTAIAARPAALHQALKESLEHGSRELQANALDLAVQCADFEIVTQIIGVLCDRRSPLHEHAGHSLAQLADRLYAMDHPAQEGPSSPRTSRHTSQIRGRVLAALDKACASFKSLIHPEPVIHAVFVVGDPESFAVKRILGQAEADCREMAGRVLASSTHPGVMQFILDSLSRNYPHVRALHAFSKRTDLEFICHVLRQLPARLTLFQQKNLRQVTSIAWLEDDLETLQSIPPDLHPALVNLVTATGLPQKVKVAAQEWIVRHGTPEGRIAASGVLRDLEQSEVRGIIAESLESGDEKVQAWATAQLRSFAVPHALDMLVKRLDSPLPEVRKAARDELQSFDVHLILEIFHSLEPEICRRAGMLVRKIDPLCLQKLDMELSHPVRRRRIRAARGAQAMGVHGELAAGLLVMLEDGDPLVRRTAVEVLADVPSVDILDAVSAHLSDESPRVRDAARKSADDLRRQLDQMGVPQRESSSDARELDETAAAR